MLKQFLKEEEGQTTVEYLLIIGVVVVVISVMGNQMKSRITTLIGTIFDGVNGQVSNLMKAGNN